MMILIGTLITIKNYLTTNNYPQKETMKNILIILSLLLVSCINTPSTSPRINHVDSQLRETSYSKYFSKLDSVANKQVVAHIMITLGKERLPKDYTGIRGWGKLTDKNYKEGIFEAVTEVYFSNITDQEISFTLHSIKTTGKKDFENQTITIKPKSFYKTKAFITIASKYKTEFPYQLDYTYQKQKKMISGTIKRQAMDELDREKGQKEIDDFKESLRKK